MWVNAGCKRCSALHASPQTQAHAGSKPKQEQPSALITPHFTSPTKTSLSQNPVPPSVHSFRLTTIRFPFRPRRTLSELKLQHGDIIIYQRQLTEQDVAGLPGPVRYPTADSYLSYVHNRRVVRFRRLEEPHGEPAVTLELLKNTTYDEVGINGRTSGGGTSGCDV